MTLLPGEFSADIVALISRVPLLQENPPKYEAVSYAWGSPNFSSSIKIGTSGADTLAVTQNLADALRYLRYKDKPRVLWIDAVCVNQQELDERGHQVKRMGDVYRLAERVVVWLGPEGKASTYALSTLEELGSNVEVDWRLFTMEPASKRCESHWSDLKKALPYGRKELVAINDLFHRPWFERLWVWQEIKLANKHAILTCGLDVISWQCFRQAVYCLFHKNVSQYISYAQLEQVYQICGDASIYDLVGLTHQTENCKCYDPKDRVYALLGILNRGRWSIDIEPDYTKTTCQAYLDVVLEVIHSSRRLDTLTACELREEKPSMPTWVPDWSIPSTFKGYRRGMADGRVNARVRCGETGILSVTGKHLAIVEHVEKVSLGSDYASTIAEIQRLAPHNIMHGSNSGIESIFDAFCRTVCEDGFSNR